MQLEAHSITEDEERVGSLWHYHLPGGEEIVIYPLLYGEARLCTGRIDRDHWDRAYDYKTPEEAIAAAEAWVDTEQEPPGQHIRSYDQEGGKRE